MHDDRLLVARRAALLPVVAVALILAGCGGGGGDKEGGGGKVTTTLPEDKTFEEVIGFDLPGIQKRRTAVENLVADCMKEQGFEYTPIDPVAERAALVGSGSLSEEDFEKQFGYGITTLYEQRHREAATGPNAEYRQSLPANQRTAYDRALYGKKVGATFAVAVDTGDFGDLGGCTKEATDTVFKGADVVTTLQTKLDELDTRIETDARMVAANKEWSACMRKAGFSDLAKPDDVDGFLEDKLEEIVGPNNTRVGIGAPEPKYDKKALADLQRQEVALVKADTDCAEEHIDKVEEGVRKEYEKAFAQENAAFINGVPRP